MPVPCSGRALRPRRRRRAARVAGATTAATALVLTTALPASAHVTVSSPDATPGGFGKLVLRVPTESATASTTRVTVSMPGSTPFAFVSSKPVPGWTVRTTERRLDKPVTDDDGFTLTKAVSTVTWTATGKGLGPGQFEEFELSVGPFPDRPAKLSLPTTQGYSDGSVVRWDDPASSGGKEPEHPAPVLDLRARPSGAEADHDAARDDGPARWLGGAGLVLGLLALGVAATTGRRRGTVAP